MAVKATAAVPVNTETNTTLTPEFVETTLNKVGEYVKNRAIFFGLLTTPDVNFLDGGFSCSIKLSERNTYKNANEAIEDQKKTLQNRFNLESTTSYVYKLKFVQNPDLRKLLMATKDACLVHSGPDYTWSDGYDGFGKNKYGTILMQIREELGGTGVVKPPGGAFALCDIRKKQIGFDLLKG